MELLLIRHGQSRGNEESIVQGQLDSGLSEFGENQAEKLKNYFNHGDISSIYSSTLCRAIQTATPTAKKLNLEINLDSNLQEAHFGIWEGLTEHEVKEKYNKEYTDWHKDYFIRPHWFEAFDKHQSRVKKTVEKILQSHKHSDKVAVFTHGGSIKTQIGYFQKLNGKELANFSLSNCSLTLISFNHSGKYDEGKIIYYNKKVL